MIEAQRSPFAIYSIEPVRAGPNKPSLITLAIAAGCAICAPITAHFEGERHRAYLDPAKIPTYCIGETENVDWRRAYGHEECSALLNRRLREDYAPRVLRCVPGLADPRRIAPFAMAIDASYNAGPAAFCRSKMAARFNAGDWAGGCAAFRGWYVTARIGGRPTMLPGLVARRQAEATECMKGAGK